jgi:hypothetical protein
MMQRFLFNRVDAESGGTAVGSQHHFIAVPFADEAETALPGMKPAVAGAEVALNSTVR